MHQGSKSFNNEDYYLYQQIQIVENYLCGTKYFNIFLIQHSKSLDDNDRIIFVPSERAFKRQAFLQLFFLKKTSTACTHRGNYN